MTEMAAFARRIRERRKELGMSQDALANAVGATQAAISRYEAGEVSPNAEVLLAMARVMKTSTDWLLGMTAENILGIWVEADLTDVERDILLLVRGNSAEKQKVLLAVLREVQKFSS